MNIDQGEVNCSLTKIWYERMHHGEIRDQFNIIWFKMEILGMIPSSYFVSNLYL